MHLADAVNASVAVPLAIRPVEHDGRQFADGLTIDGFPLAELALGEGLDRLFVIGVAPREALERPVRTAYGALLRTAEINQYSETTRGLERAERAQDELRKWFSDFEAVLGVLAEAQEPGLVAEARRAFDAAEFPGADHAPVEIVSILPQRPIHMFFTSYRPSRSRELLEVGRRDALAVLRSLTDRSGPAIR